MFEEPTIENLSAATSLNITTFPVTVGGNSTGKRTNFFTKARMREIKLRQSDPIDEIFSS